LKGIGYNNKVSLFNNKDLEKAVLLNTSASELQNIDASIRNFDKATWEKYRSKIAIIGNIHKFHQNKSLQNYLVSTQHQELVAADPCKIWGIGMLKNSLDIDNIYLWQGSNLLGFFLMAVRDFLVDFGDFELPAKILLPPWVKYPEYECSDLFWRMGRGEQYQAEFSQFYCDLSQREQLIYSLYFPEPFRWMGGDPLTIPFFDIAKRC
jgi:hypothetical protein